MFKVILSILLAVSFLPLARAANPIDLGEGHQPQVAISARGEILVTFGRDNTIFFTHSTDGGKTFGASSIVAKPKFTPLGMRRGPRIAATHDGVVIAAVAGEKGGGKDGDVFVWRSIDNGNSWRQTDRLNHIETSAREGLIGIASDGENRIVVVWLDDRSQKKEVYGALSTDGGHTFGDDTLIYRSPDGHVCECCHPSALFAGDSNLYVMFRNWIDGDRDMYIARSRDGGRSFDGSASKLGNGSWKINACPMDGGGLSVLDDQPITIWQRQGQIYFASPGHPEQLIGPGMQPTIAGQMIAYTTVERHLMLMSAIDAPAVQIAQNAADPSLAGDAHRAACAWESNGHCFILSDSALINATHSSTQPSP